jgi:hypothetical protein
MYPLLNTDSLVKLAWSDNFVLSWFGLCQRFNDDGLEFEIYSYTKELVVTENSIHILYEHYLSDNWQSSNKLKILF